MSSPVNQSPRMSPQPFNTSFASSQGNNTKSTEQAAQRTLNTNRQPTTRKRAREEELREVPHLHFKIPGHLMRKSEVQPPSERASVQQPSPPKRAPLPQTVSSNLDAPMNHPQPRQRSIQPSQIIETPVQPKQAVNPKLLRPLSNKPLKDAQQVISDNAHDVSVNPERLKHAEKTLDEYKRYEKHMIEIRQQAPKELLNLKKQMAKNEERAWGLVAGDRNRTGATEEQKKHAERLKLSMQKFSSERQTFIKNKAEEITKDEISLEQQENERLKKFAEEISQIESD